MDWWEGPTNAIDRCIIEWGMDVYDIADRLVDVPMWLIRERWARYHAQYVPAWASESGTSERAAA